MQRDMLPTQCMAALTSLVASRLPFAPKTWAIPYRHPSTATSDRWNVASTTYMIAPWLSTTDSAWAPQPHLDATPGVATLMAPPCVTTSCRKPDQAYVCQWCAYRAPTPCAEALHAPPYSIGAPLHGTAFTPHTMPNRSPRAPHEITIGTPFGEARQLTPRHAHPPRSPSYLLTGRLKRRPPLPPQPHRPRVPSKTRGRCATSRATTTPRYHWPLVRTPIP